MKPINVIKSISVEPGLLAFYLGIFFLYSAFQPLVYSKACDNFAQNLNSSWTCQDIKEPQLLQEVSKDVSHWIFYSSLCFSLPSIIVDILLGSWGDKYGRKLPMILPSVGGMIATVIYILMCELEQMTVWWLCLASILSGLCGGPTGAVAAAFSYIAVVTDEEARTSRCAILESMSYLAGTVAPFIAGKILQKSSKTLIFSISGGFYALNIIYTLIFIREPNISQMQSQQDDTQQSSAGSTSSHSDYLTSANGGHIKGLQTSKAASDEKPLEHKESVSRPAASVTLFSLHHLKESFMTVAKPRPARLRIILLLTMTFLIQMLFTGELDILYLYLNELKLDWEKIEVQFSYIFGGKYLAASVALLIVLPILRNTLSLGRARNGLRWNGIPDHIACGAGIIYEIIAFLIFGLAKSLTTIIISLVVGAPSAWAISTSRSLLSKTVPTNEIGKLFGIVAVLGDLSLLLGSLFYNNVFPILSFYNPGATHLTVAGILLLPLGILIFVEVFPGTRLTPVEQPHEAGASTQGTEAVETSAQGGRTNEAYEA